MFPLALPAPAAAAAPPFSSAAGAQAWLARQPQVQPRQMQAALQSAIAALDAADLPPAERLEILDVLRQAVIPTQAALESRYARKPLPLPPGDAEVFAASRALWRVLALAYLRSAARLPAAAALLPLHRGAVALRLEQYGHFLAAEEVPAELLHLLYGALAAAEALGVRQTPLADPAYKHLGESHLAGHAAWAFLLQLVDPYRLSPAQLAVANRAFGRWRELALFRAAPEADPKARAVPLFPLLAEAGELQAGLRWLDVRPVARKIRKRIEALQAGETPEALKLGRELSATACIRLLAQLDEALRPGRPPAAGGGGKLAFGPENAYVLLAGRTLNPAAMDAASRSLSHQRMALFGFDNFVGRPASAVRAEVPGEIWQDAAGRVWRAPEAGARHLSPCLVAMPGEGKAAPRLGMLAGLHMSAAGCLQGTLQWYPPPVEASWLKAAGRPRLPVFLLDAGGELSVILPAGAGVRPGEELALEESPVGQLRLGEVRERGSDFVRYAARLLRQAGTPD